MRAAVDEICPSCRVAKVMRHCKDKGCDLAQCKRCATTFRPPEKESTE